MLHENLKDIINELYAYLAVKELAIADYEDEIVKLKKDLSIYESSLIRLRSDADEILRIINNATKG